MTRSLLIAALALAATLPAHAQEDPPTQPALREDYAKRIRPLLERYCIGCHDQGTETKLRLDNLPSEIAPETIAQWTDVKNKLDVGAMPKGKDRPTREELAALLGWIGGSLQRYDADHRESGGDVLIRRINNRAFVTMVRTLLDVPAPGSADFPDDGHVRGFDTVGSGLYATTSQYEAYWASAHAALDMAIPGGAKQPETREERKPFKWKNSGFEDSRSWLHRALTNLEKHPESFRSAYYQDLMGRVVLPPSLKDQVNPHFVGDVVAKFYGEKTYKDVVAKGIDWTTDAGCREAMAAEMQAQIKRFDDMEPYVSEFQPVGVGSPTFMHQLNLKIATAGRYVMSSRLCLLNERCPLPVGFYLNGQGLRSFMLYDPQSAPRAYEQEVYLTPGSYGFRVQAGLPTAITHSEHGTYHYYVDYLVSQYGISEEAIKRLIDFDSHHNYVTPPPDPSGRSNQLDLPSILCADIVVRGPLYDGWPTAAAKRIFTRGVDAPPSRDYAREIVAAFMKRAYAQGEPDAETVEPYVDLVMSNYETGKDFVAAVKYALAGILVSPRFLYLEEHQRADAAHRQPLAACELARRLAYFLWSDLPDDALVASALGGALLRDDELAAQTRRMLADPRSRAFRQAFTAQWLRIDRLESIPFSHDALPAFTNVLLESAKEESIAYFSEVLDRGLSVTAFIDSDFAMVDGCLAHHYGIPGVSGDEFRRVQLPPGSHRGGVLNQASVLMATSNGMVGSLVRRGAFVMDRLLGLPPGQPPPGVAALDKQKTTRDDGTPLTPRERLASHRADQSCARCHDLIDPLGVGLEHYDALGRWGEKQKVLLAMPDTKTHSLWVEEDVNARGALPDGTAFDGAEGLKARLLEHGDRFARILAENLAIYALGRDLELSDRPLLDALCARLAANGNRLSFLIEDLVRSPLFRDK
jgi:hypothetical protein